jgi:hypothetical protein
MAAIREYRRRETWGDAYHKPRVYRGIDALEKAHAPFLRTDFRR